MAYCAKCKKETLTGNFCNECGATLTQEVAATQNNKNNSSHSTTEAWRSELLDLGLPLMISSQVNNLSHDQQTFFLNQYERKRKSKLLAYLLLFAFGLHYLYIGKWGIQFLFWFTGGGFGIWWLVDIFRVPGMISEKNNDIAVEALLMAKNF